MGEHERGRPKGAAPELSTDQGSSSLEVYVTPTPSCHATRAERAALEAGVCIVCGHPDPNLSSLARCWSCIKTASGEWEAKVAADRRQNFPPRPPCTRCVDPTSRCDRPRFLRDLRPCAPERRRFTPPPPGSPPTSPQAVQARLSGLLRTLNNTTEGSRNATLHWAACRVGEMLAANELPDAQRAADTLAQVALGIGLHPSEVRGTIRSGLATYGVSA